MKYGLCVLGFVLAGCAGKPARAPQVDAAPPTWKQTVSLNEGQTVTLADAGFKIGFVIPIKDDRCPAYTTCIQQGHFLGKFFFESLVLNGGPNQGFVYLMSTNRGCGKPECGPFIFTGSPQGELESVYYELTLENVRPERVQGREILEPYRVQIHITNGP